MKIMPLKEAKEQIGIEGISIQGKIIEVYPIKKGQGEYGEYSFQNILIDDGTDKLIVSLNNQEEITDKFKGRKVTFASTYVETQEKNMGIKIIEESYKGKDGKMHKITKAKITPSAEITWGETTKEEAKPEAPIDDKSSSFDKSYAKDIVVALIQVGAIKDPLSAGLQLKNFYNLFKEIDKLKLREEELHPIEEGEFD